MSQNNTTATPVEIRKIANDDKKGIDQFIDLLWKIYDPHKGEKEFAQFVPPLRIAVKEALDVKNNPFYKRAEIQLFMAFQNGKPVGRIAAIKNNAHNEFYKDTVGFYGFFECIDSQEVANALFNAAEAWLKEKGLTVMRGPMNPSTNHECGLLIRGQSQHPTLMTTWNPKYYEPLHDNAGLTKAKDLVAYILMTDKGVGLPQKVIDYVKKLRGSTRIKFRDFNLKDFQGEVDKCFDIYNAAWEQNWGFFPMTKEEFNFTAKDMKMIVDPRLAFMAEVEGKPAGFMLAVPDINYVQKRIPDGRLFPFGIFKLLIGRKMVKFLRIITLGVKPEFRGSGIFALFTYEAFERAKKYGYVGGEASWILEDNVPMNKPWQELGAPRYRLWRIYDRAIQ